MSGLHVCRTIKDNNIIMYIKRIPYEDFRNFRELHQNTTHKILNYLEI